MTERYTQPMTDHESIEQKSRSARVLEPLRPLLPYALRQKRRIVLAIIALSAAAAATLVLPLAVRGMIDHGFSAENAGAVNSYFGMMILVVGALALASGTRYYLVMTIGERVVTDLRADMFRHLSRLDATFFDTAKTGELMSRLTADTTQMKSAFGSSASVALRNLFLFLGAIVMMVATSPKLSGLVLVADSVHRCAADRLRPRCPSAFATCAGYACGRLRFRSGKSGLRSDHAGLRR